MLQGFRWPASPACPTSSPGNDQLDQSPNDLGTGKGLSESEQDHNIMIAIFADEHCCQQEPAYSSASQEGVNLLARCAYKHCH